MKVNRNEVGSNRHSELLMKSGGRKLSKSRLLKKATKAMTEWITIFHAIPLQEIPFEEWSKDYD